MYHILGNNPLAYEAPLLAIATMATAQIKIATSGQVFMGGYTNTHHQVLLNLEKNGGKIAIGPNDGGSNIGSSLGQIDFWYPSVNGNSYIWNKVRFKSYALGSDSTLKTNITPLKNATALLKQIKTYSYYFKSDSIYLRGDSIDLRKREYGVLAQEIEAILPDLVDTAKGSMCVNYNAFISILIKGFNEQQTVIENQQREITTLQNIVVSQELDLIKLEKLESEFHELQDVVFKCCDNPKGMPMLMPQEEAPPAGETAILYQNAPNPFSSNTEISCYLPENATQGTIFIYNLQGVQLLDFSVTQTGMNTITVYGSELPAGMYLYSLVVDNEIIDTKRMILTK